MSTLQKWGCIKKKNKFKENTRLHKNLYTNAHSSPMHNSKRVEATQMAMNKWKDKQNAEKPHNGLLFSHTKEGSIGIYYNTEEP